jgi:pantothenate kinase
MSKGNRLSLEGYPQKWARHIHALSGEMTLDVAGFATLIDITPSHLEQLYFPVLACLDDLTINRNERVLAGLAGIPGSGKSTFAAALAHIADILFSPDRLISVGLDGWHWPNEELDRRTTRDQTGKSVPLRLRKGGPDSFDVNAMAEQLQELPRRDCCSSLPQYDRMRHDPIPDALSVLPDTRIILLEGNFVLCRTSPWNQVSDLLHPKFFLKCDRQVARQRIIERHIRGGANPAQAVDKFENNDRLNIETVETCIASEDTELVFLEFPEESTRNCRQFM